MRHSGTGLVDQARGEENKLKKSREFEVSVVEEGSGDPEVALLSKQLSQLVTIVEGIKSQQVAAVSEGAEKKKEETPEQELKRLRKEKESGEWAQRYSGSGNGGRRKEDKGGKGGGGKDTGCWTCGGPHCSNQCPWNTGGKGGGKSWGGGNNWDRGSNWGGGKGWVLALAIY